MFLYLPAFPKQKIIPVFLFCLLHFSAYGQKNYTPKTSSISGRITDQNKTPIAYATVSLLNESSTPLYSEWSNDDGEFLLSDLKEGQYTLEIHHLEFETYHSEQFFIPEGGSKNFNDLILRNSSVKLDELVVTGKKALIEIHADKMVFNVSSSPSASGTHALDLLSKSPGVNLDMDNNISLLGKGGVQIYVNGVPSRLSGTDLATMLQSITSDNVESIEIITNPSARHEAEGNAGIINIRLKKNQATGFNGSLVSSFTKGTYFRTNNSLGLQYGNEKIKLTFDINRSTEDILDNLLDQKYQNDFLLDLKSYDVRSRTGYNAAVGMDILLSPKHTLSFSGRGIQNQNDNILVSTTGIYLVHPIGKAEILKSQTVVDIASLNINGNLGYKWDIHESSFLQADLSFGNFQSQKFTEQPNTYFAPDEETILSVVDNEFNSDTKIDIWSAKVDYEKSWQNISFSAGGKYAGISTDNHFAFYNIFQSEPVPDPEKSNDFTYTEKVFALYGVLDFKIGKFFKINTGLRLENTASRGRLLSDLPIQNKDVPRNYTDFFPNIGLSFDGQKNHTWSISLGRRITRPNYQDLNPFESPLSQLVVWKGNPFLKPNYIMNYQVSYAYKQKLTITNRYSVTKDFFATIFEVQGEKGNILIPRNMDKSTQYGVSVSYPLEINKSWDITAFVNGSYQTYRGNLEGTVIDLEVNNYSFRIQNNVNLPWGIIMDLTYNYGSDWIWRGSIRVRGNHRLNFGLKKDFWNKRFQLRITGADVLRTDSDYFYNGDYGGILVEGVRTFDNSRFGLGATWNFGNQKAKLKKKSESALEEELDRLQPAGN